MTRIIQFRSVRAATFRTSATPKTATPIFPLRSALRLRAGARLLCLAICRTPTPRPAQSRDDLGPFLVRVMLLMHHCRFSRMVARTVRMSVGRMCVVSRLFGVARLVMLGGIPVVRRRVLVLLRRLEMMLGCFFRRELPPWPAWIAGLHR